ncbi:MAG: sporulation protein YqfD [Christensenellaceae bacterium]|jgi:hypothetical protein|nr:sporulation protein YqfD [Christensenellaceae bacterium]
MKNFWGAAEFKVKDLNISTLNSLKQYNLSAVSHKEDKAAEGEAADEVISFRAPIKYKKKILKLLKNHEVSARDKFGAINVFRFFIKKPVLVLIMLGLVFVASLFNNLIFNIKIYGASGDREQEVFEYIEALGVKKFGRREKLSNTELIAIENNFAWVAHATSEVRGHTLIINVYEAENNVKPISFDIYSAENAVISHINVFSGTVQVKVGDVVQRGDLLVRGVYLDKLGAEVPIRAEADIWGIVSFSKSKTFKYDAEIESIKESLARELITENFLETPTFKTFIKIENDKKILEVVATETRLV